VGDELLGDGVGQLFGGRSIGAAGELACEVGEVGGVGARTGAVGLGVGDGEGGEGATHGLRAQLLEEIVDGAGAFVLVAVNAGGDGESRTGARAADQEQGESLAGGNEFRVVLAGRKARPRCG
jgi:hypothetical protein